jgi:hypothetical protein
MKFCHWPPGRWDPAEPLSPFITLEQIYIELTHTFLPSRGFLTQMAYSLSCDVGLDYTLK